MSSRLDATLRHLENLVALDTRNPPRAITAEHAVWALLRDALGSGFTHDVTDHGDGCVSLLAVRGRPSLLFNFHVDTVPVDAGWRTDPFTLVVADGKATGLGAADTKGAVACMLAAAREARGDVALLFTSDEEAGSSTCVRRFLETRPRYDGVIVAEPTGARAVLAHRGICTFQVEFTGVAGHASGARADADSAVHDLLRWGERAVSIVRVWDRHEHHGVSGVRFNVGVVEGGTKPNMIASRASARCGFRAHAGLSDDDILDAFRKLAPHPDRFRLTPGFRAPSLPAPGNAAADALAHALGLETGPAVDFWTEASLFSAAGWPAIVLGAGDIAQAHTADEWVALSQLEELAGTYVKVLSQ